MQIKKPANIYAEDAASATLASNDTNKGSEISNKAAGPPPPPIDQTPLIIEPENNSDYIPLSLYDNLPTLLKTACAIFNDRHERDIFLLGALSALGGCFHNLHAYNEVDKRRIAANLLLFIIAPSASGKGALKYARKLVAEIKKTFSANSKIIGSKDLGKILIPANISSAGLIQLLQKNSGIGIIIESEIDTLVNANKQEWGNYSDTLRNSFENESASLYRKTDKEHVEIENLKLSLAISGTPSQFKSLMYSAENGLFSRGCYYVIDSPNEKLECYGRMNSVGGKDLDTLFADFANSANDCYNLHLGFDQINVVFSEDQLAKIQAALKVEYTRLAGYQELGANIKRSFTITLKIASILTLLKECESGKLTDKISCSELALDTAIQLVQTLLIHGYKAYDILPKKNRSLLSVNQGRLYIDLPSEFTREEAVNIGKTIKISTRTVDGYLKVYKDKNLVEVTGQGKYRKLE